MELKAYFTNIHQVIIDHLKLAESEIIAAVAWFTDRDIFEVLCDKARSGVKVSIVLIGDQINQGPGGLNFHRLVNGGGQVIFLPPASRNERTMHHKFCVVDQSTVITGSYNWSQKARSNDENITVVTDSATFANKFLETFENILVRTGNGAPVVADADAARRRLEMIRNLVLLGEQDDVVNQLRKLRPVAETLDLVQIIEALDKGEYKAALEHIDAYLRRATALVVAGYADIALLRFQLEILEIRLQSLSDEKADLDRLLITFNRRHDEALGDLIRRILKARAELARLHATERKCGKEREQAEAQAQEAEDIYEDFSRQHEELQQAEPLPKLDEEADRELRSLYRKACSLCHPDKVTEDKKSAAHDVFVDLQDAYKANDLARVREIYKTLVAGGVPGTRSTTLSEADALKAAIAELEYSIGRLIAELKELQESDGVKLIRAAGESEDDWQVFFEVQRESLAVELASIVEILITLSCEFEQYE